MTRKRSKNLRVFYFGADKPWKELVVHGFRRRNTCLLQGIVNNDDVSRVYVVRQTPRKEIVKQIFKNINTTEKAKDIYVTSLLPERTWIPLSQQINTLFFSFLLLCQTGKRNLSTDIIWVYWIQAYLFARRMNIKGRFLFDVDHNIIDDENLPEDEKNRVTGILTDIAQRSEYILSSSRSMIRWFEERGFSNCLLARNGIDPSRFQKELSVPQDLQKIPGPKLLYVGTLSKWIDTDFFLSLVRRRPDWNFILIGGNYKTDLSEELKFLPNVTLLGFKLADEVPPYMAHVDVGLGMYKDVEWMDVDSMKFYEYLAAGIPVVTTKYSPHIDGDFDQLIQSSGHLHDFEKMIENVLEETRQSEVEWKDRASLFVNNNTWDKRIVGVIGKLVKDE